MARSGGHAAAHAPEHALLVLESALNRYRVRPCALTRIRPRWLFASPTVAVLPLVVLGGVAAVAAPPPPHAATASALSGITAALARKVMGLLRVMSLLGLGVTTLAAIRIDRITQHVVRHPKTS